MGTVHPTTAQQASARAARVAWRRGRAALRFGQIEETLRWLDRACRLAPADPVLRLGLATAWLRQTPARAIPLFETLTRTRPSWEAWLGLAAARRQSGDPIGAAAALGQTLGKFAAPTGQEWRELADQIAPGGWCAITGDGTLRIGPSGLMPPDLLLDGKPVAWRDDRAWLRERLTRSHARTLAVRRFGNDVVGSPIDLSTVSQPRIKPPATIKIPIRAAPPPLTAPTPRATDVIIPIYRDAAATLACLDSVLTHRPRGTRIIVIDDATPEPDLARALEKLSARRRILLIRHTRNQGFPAAANAGLAKARAAGNDALLLNADTLVGPGFVNRLRATAYAAANIGTACPLSNNATILSYPDPGGGNAMPDRAETVRLAALAWASNRAGVVDIPTAVGFCMFLRHDCLKATGAFRADIFGRGYGEENDFCARASAAGWRHVAAPGVFVAHAGEASFGAWANGLRARNEKILTRLHPDYPARIAAHIAADPLLPARRRIDLARRRAAQPAAAKAVLLITHAQGGGVARSVAARRAALHAEGRWPIELTPTDALDRTVGIAGYPNLRFTLPEDQESLVTLLRTAETDRIEFHHTLGHPEQILALPRILQRPYTVHVHDYHWLCPRLVLSASHGRYCGEPDLTGCNACIRRRGGLLGEPISVADLRRRSAALFGGAERVIAPSADAAGRLRRYFSAVTPVVQAPAEPAYPDATAVTGGKRRRIAVVGAIGPEKGFHVLLDLAREAAANGQDLEFVVIGHTIGDAALLRTGRVVITGPYQPEEAVDLIRAQNADLALLPSVVPETWCHALTEIWQAGLRVAAFDLGAQAERIRARGQGPLLPAGLPPAAINRALLAARW